MNPPAGDHLTIGRRIALTLGLLIVLILGGNGLVISQFENAHIETGRLTGVSQQLIAVLRLQEILRSFHERLNELTASKDAERLVAEAPRLRADLLAEVRQTRNTLAYLPPDFHADPAFVTALDTIEITLPEQLQDVADLARAGDWETVHLRLNNELDTIEKTTSAYVKTIDRDLDEELPHVMANMRTVERRIFWIVPATAISTVLVASLFGWVIARRMLELRVEERVNERTRIAREFHDTLLQSFQAVLMKFQAAVTLIPDRPGEAQKRLEGVIEQARRALAEGRNAVQGLRSSTVTANDLAQAITALGTGLAADRAGGEVPEFHVHVDGVPRNFVPLVRDEVYRIAGEALRNAFEHSEAHRIEVEIRYEPRRFRLLVRDNGKGIAAEILDGGGRPGHWGLPGMHERAKLVGGKLAVWSEPHSGTEIELRIPSSAAFGKWAGTKGV